MAATGRRRVQWVLWLHRWEGGVAIIEADMLLRWRVRPRRGRRAAFHRTRDSTYYSESWHAPALRCLGCGQVGDRSLRNSLAAWWTMLTPGNWRLLAVRAAIAVEETSLWIDTNC